MFSCSDSNPTGDDNTTFTLTIISNNGTVTKNPDKTKYKKGDIVNLSVTPDSGYIFTGWSGDVNGTNATIDVTMDGNKTITANYDAIVTSWVKIIGGANSDYGRRIIEVSDGNYVLVGLTSSFGAGQYDIWLIKINTNGDTLWTKTYGEAGFDVGNCVQQTSDNGFIITGETESFGTSIRTVFLLKTDSNGNMLWVKKYQDVGTSCGYFVQQTTDGGFIVCGNVTLSLGNEETLLLKTDNNGNLEWNKLFGGEKNDLGHCVKQTNDNGFVIVCQSNSFSTNTADDIWLIKTDTNGDTLWTKTYGGSNGDLGRSVVITDDGYIIAGDTWSYSNAFCDIWIIKTDKNGDTLWSKNYGGDHYDQGHEIQKTNDGCFVITGYTGSDFYATKKTDIWLIKIDKDGQLLWDKRFGDENLDYGYSVSQTSDNGFVMCGTQKINPGDNQINVIIAKTD